LQEDKDIR